MQGEQSSLCSAASRRFLLLRPSWLCLWATPEAGASCESHPDWEAEPCDPLGREGACNMSVLDCRRLFPKNPHRRTQETPLWQPWGRGIQDLVFSSKTLSSECFKRYRRQVTTSALRVQSVPVDRELTCAAGLPVDVLSLESSAGLGPGWEPKKELESHFPARWGWCALHPALRRSAER